MSETAVLVLIAGAALLYFTPALIAHTNDDHPNPVGVSVLNLFLGWTFIGWMVALVWAFSRSGQPLQAVGTDLARAALLERAKAVLDEPGTLTGGRTGLPAYLDDGGQPVPAAVIDPVRFTGTRPPGPTEPLAYVETEAGQRLQMLDPGRADRPGATGVDWGYAGTAPTVLAGLVLDLCMVQVPARALVHRFAAEVLADFDPAGFALDASAVVDWLATRDQ